MLPDYATTNLGFLATLFIVVIGVVANLVVPGQF